MMDPKSIGELVKDTMAKLQTKLPVTTWNPPTLYDRSDVEYTWKKIIREVGNPKAQSLRNCFTASLFLMCEPSNAGKIIQCISDVELHHYTINFRYDAMLATAKSAGIDYDDLIRNSKCSMYTEHPQRYVVLPEHENDLFIVDPLCMYPVPREALERNRYKPDGIRRVFVSSLSKLIEE